MIIITISEKGYEGVRRTDSNGRPFVIPPERIQYRVSGSHGSWRRFEDAVRLVQIMLAPGMCVRFYTKTCRINKNHQPVTIWSLHIESDNNYEA